MNVFKKIVSVGVTMSTLFWSVGVSALLPVAASAATCQSFSSGDLIKVTGKPAIYSVDSNGKILWFPTGDEFKSWNSGETYGGYTSISAECFDALPVPSAYPAGVNFRPGSYVVKRGSSDQLYVVLPGNKLAKITAAAANSLYGSNRKTITVADTAWNNYTGRGADITEAKAHPGMLVSNGGKTWYVDADSKLWEVSAAAMSANRFKAAFVRPVSDAMVAGLVSGGVLSALNPAVADRTQTGGAGANTGPVVGGGALSVALDASNPAGVNLADSTGLNPILKLSLRAGSAAVNVTGLTLSKSGFLGNTVVTGVEVIDSMGVRHGNVASSINADNQVTLLFTGAPIKVAANSSEVATIRVNFGNVSTNGTLRLSLASASAVQADGSVSGAFPVTSNEFTVYDGSNAVAAATLDEQAVNASGATLNVDPLNWQDIAKFSLQETTSKEKVLVKEWTLYNNGTAADSDVKDIQLVAQDGSVLSTAQQVNKTVRLVLAAPYEIDKGLTKTFTVRAKIVDGASRTIQFTTYNNYDVVVVGKDSGAALLPAVGSNDTSYPIGDSTANYNKATVGNGTLSFNKDVTSPSTAVVPASTGVVLAKYYAKPTGESMELRTIALGFVTGTASVFTGSFTIRVNGASVAVVTPADMANSATSLTSVTLSTYPTLTSGQNNYVTVEGNISSSAANGATTTVYMDLTQVKRLITNDITDPTVSIVAGNQISVQAAALKVSNLSTPVTQSVVVGSNIELANIELNAGVVSSGEDVKVSSIVISQDGGGTVTDFGNLVMYGPDGQPLATSGSTATGAASTTFTFVTPIVVPKNGAVILKLKGDVTANTNGTGHVFAVRDAANHVTTVGKDTGNSVTETGGTGAGQTITTTATGALTISLVSGSNAAPTNAQIVTPGQTNVSVFAFKLTAQNEPLKLTTLRLMASGSTWTSTNNLVNIKLYRNSETTAFASASQMVAGPGTNTSTAFTWTATDNILPEVIQPGAPVTIYVKADIGGAGNVKLGEAFQFGISSTSTVNIVAKGASSGTQLDNNNTSLVSGAPILAGGVTNIVPFQVLATADAPAAGSSVTQAILAGTQLARIKLQNNGAAKVTITGIKFTDSGSHTGSSTSYTLKYSDQNSNNYVGNTASSTASGNNVADDSSSTGTDWKSGFMNTFDIDGGAYRYVTVSIGRVGSAATGDFFQYSIASLGDITFSVAETDLGYDGNLSGSLSGSITALKADGKPILGTLVKT